MTPTTTENLIDVSCLNGANCSSHEIGLVIFVTVVILALGVPLLNWFLLRIGFK